jgi:internalin A
VLVVVNKCDQHPLDLDERGLREKFPCIRALVWTDCKTKQGLPELRTAIERETGALPDLRAPFPKTWFVLKEKLEAMPDDCIAYDEYQKLCAANEEKDTDNQGVLIGFLNDLGSVLHFRDETRLCDLGVLKPDWVTQGIYGLLNADSIKAAGGVLAMSQLGALLDRARYPKRRYDYLLALMEKFELCFEMPDTQHAKFLIPELLPKETPELPEWKNVDTLAFEYHYNILPEGLLPRFIVRTHRLSEGCARWRHGVELRQGEANALVRADVQERRVFIAVRGLGRQPRDLLAVIRQQFEEIHGGIKGLTAEEKVPVPGYPTVKPLDYRELLVMEAGGETEVKIVAASKVVKLPLGRLLDNFEKPASRRERATNIINIHDGGKLIMPSENYDFSGAQIFNSVVGAHMQNINLAIQQLPPERAELRAALEELHQHAKPGLIELTKTQPDEAEKAAKRLDQFVEAAKEKKPDKDFLQVTSKGLIDAAKTVAAMAGPIIATVDKLRPLLGF